MGNGCCRPRTCTTIAANSSSGKPSRPSTLSVGGLVGPMAVGCKTVGCGPLGCRSLGCDGVGCRPVRADEELLGLVVGAMVELIKVRIIQRLRL